MKTELFEEIAEDAVRAAEKVECPFSEFIEGLDIIRRTVTERLALATDEHRANEHRAKEK